MGWRDLDRAWVWGGAGSWIWGGGEVWRGSRHQRRDWERMGGRGKKQRLGVRLWGTWGNTSGISAGYMNWQWNGTWDTLWRVYPTLGAVLPHSGHPLRQLHVHQACPMGVWRTWGGSSIRDTNWGWNGTVRTLWGAYRSPGGPPLHSGHPLCQLHVRRALPMDLPEPPPLSPATARNGG